MERATPLGRSLPKRRRCEVGVDAWLSLPPELLVEVFRRLDATTDVVNCAGTCKSWRCAIIENASSLQPCSDRFNPNLLLGFFYQCKAGVFLRCIPDVFQSTLLATTGGKESNYDMCMPRDRAARAGEEGPGGGKSITDLALYNRLLSSRGGLVLLKSSLNRDVVDLCLCNPMTGACMFLPDATLEVDAYVLVTGNDLSPSEPDDMAVGIQIIAVKSEYNETNTTLQYQHFSYTSSNGTGSWGSSGPVMRSGKFKERLIVSVDRDKEVVCGATIYWLGYSISIIVPAYSVAAMNMCSGETNTIDLKECLIKYFFAWRVLATTIDDRPSLLGNDRQIDKSNNIQIWVQIKGEQWFLQQTIHVPNLCFKNDIFWPRSGYLLVEKDGGPPLLIDVEVGSSCPISCHATVPNYGGSRYPYEMDLSTCQK
ncbi:unnamed protein product [Urochloa decumbens]|uniref:F-box domain-containing protein n=1 Tax=Urochloa decumbens TaxID=240449 RepID=A0ABC9CI67_9POAL